MLAIGQRLQGHLWPSAAELMIVITGLEEVIQGGWQLVCMETDCLESVSLVNGVGECFADEVC